MKAIRIAQAIAILFLVVPFGQAAAINPVWEYSTAELLTDPRPFTLGFEFTTSVVYHINALGYWYDGGTHGVGIWDNGGNLLVSTTVMDTDTVTGHFAYHAVAYTLAPGTYTIGGEFLGGEFPDFPNNASGVTSLAGYTWVADKYVEGAGLNFPNIGAGTYGTNGIPVVDFSVEGSASPEPGSLLLIGSGLVLLAGTLRRKLRP